MPGPPQRRTLMLALLAGCCLLQVAVAGPARAQAEARITNVTPARLDDLIVCRLETRGLPGQKLLASMRSGLVSAIALDLAVVDEGDQVVGGNRLTLQLAFDLWEEIFSVRGDGLERRFRTLGQMQRYLADLPEVPVAPLSELSEGARYRLRVGLQVHPIAPAQRERIGDVIAGDRHPRHEGQDRQEASVSLGRLIRFFYQGGGEGRAGRVTVSAWFTREGVDHAAH